MPFKSKSQLRTCFAGRMPGVNCKEWLSKTPDIGCLPEKTNYPPPRKCRMKRKNEPVIGKIKTGPRGGKYFDIQQNGDKIRVYIPRKKSSTKKSSSQKTRSRK